VPAGKLSQKNSLKKSREIVIILSEELFGPASASITVFKLF
jgi:hypothetical protein